MQTADLERARKTFIRAEWVSAAVAVIIALVASVSGYAVVRYKTDENSTTIGVLKSSADQLDQRVTRVETKVSDMASELDRIEDNSRLAIGLPPVHKR